MGKTSTDHARGAPSSKPIHMVGLDHVRFIAAYLVVFDHFSSFGWAFPSGSARADAAAFPSLHRMGDIGPVGVEIFFLLSGFVIVASVRGATAGQFLLNRAIRVFPALWICGAIAFAARAAAGEPISVLARSFLRSAVLSPVGPYVDGVVWTLIVEATFYALIFLVILSDGRLKFETVAKVLGCLSSVFICVLVATQIAESMDPGLSPVAAYLERFPFKVFLLRHGVFFALGMGVWSAFERGFTTRRALWLAAFFVFATIEVAVDRGGLGIALAVVAVWWLGAAATVSSIAFATPIHRRTERWRGLFADMGRFSYPLYLNHYTLGQVVVPALVAAGLSRSSVFAGSLLIVSVTSYLVMRFPERILQGALRSRLQSVLARGRRAAGGLDASALVSDGGGARRIELLPVAKRQALL